MSFITPHRTGPQKSGGRRNEINRTYANPLPLLFSDCSQPLFRTVCGLLGLSIVHVLNPHCEAYFDASTRSVWVANAKDSEILWRRGFFGKGNLSRSEPSWLSRQLNARRTGGKQMTSEEVTAKRRAERKQFKLDRARAMAAAVAEAEAAFAEGRVVSPTLTADGGRVIPSAATWKPQSATGDTATLADDFLVEDDEPLENIEHLQLTLAEAFFLLWNLDCLTVLDPTSHKPMTLQQIWLAFLSAQLHTATSPELHSISNPPFQFDNPFLINYVVYHHYRSLGWVVKGGIKFCVDFLLYKRGPAFHHAEFAVVVCPVYEDPTDQEVSPFNLENSSPFTWSWLSTINRVNSQVQKTLVLAYVVIPARCRVSARLLSSPACLSHYSVREVTLRRFIPARMRD